jgi:membrane-bound ClpP family serine protease
MLAWAVILLLAAALLLLLELLLPTGGLLGIGSFGCLVAGIVCLFSISVTAGLIGLLGAFVTVPIVLIMAMRVFPHSPIGRLMVHREALADSAKLVLDPARDQSPDRLVGAAGSAVTGLRPVGICLIDGRRIECVSESGVIEPGVGVKVTSVHGLEVKVRAT